VKFYWDSLKIILDLLKANGKTMSIYADTASKAFHFCEKYNRRQECQQLCEILLIHKYHLFKNAKLGPQNTNYAVDIDDPKTLKDMLQIRLN
jgi:translation initiation factor 3 subunit A